jgi:hypothetical protein
MGTALDAASLGVEPTRRRVHVDGVVTADGDYVGSWALPGCPRLLIVDAEIGNRSARGSHAPPWPTECNRRRAVGFRVLTEVGIIQISQAVSLDAELFTGTSAQRLVALDERGVQLRAASSRLALFQTLPVLERLLHDGDGVRLLGRFVLDAGGVIIPTGPLTICDLGLLKGQG